MYWPENEFRTIEKVKHIPQKSDWDCGLAVYAMNLSRFGLEIPPTHILIASLGATAELGTPACKLAKLSNASIPGAQEVQRTNIYEVEKSLRRGSWCVVDYQSVASADLGHKGHVICDFGSLEPANDFEWGHYSIIVDQDRTGFYMSDPALIDGVDGLPEGVRRVPKIIFESRWIDKEITSPVVDHWMVEI